jgi:hypothetical protein
MTEPFSPAAQAVLDAAFTLADNFDRDVTEAEMIAAALRAAADQIENLYCDSDVEDSPGIVFAMRHFLAIAAELETSTTENR